MWQVQHLESRTLFSVLFADEFNGTALDAAKWSNTANWGVDHPQNELQTYTRTGNLTVANGAATITAKRGANGAWSSAEFQSGGTYAAGGSVSPEFSLRYGYVQVRAKMPKGTGSWPALWSMPTPASPGALNDGAGEIDGMEFEGDAPNNVQAHLHHGGTYGATYRGSVDLSNDYHLYGWEWQAGSLKWDVDGTVYAQTTANVPNANEFLIINLAISDGIFGNPPDSSTPATMNYSIDFVHVTSTKAEAFGGAPATSIYDLDNSGSIDVGDLAILAGNYNKTGTNLLGDFDKSGKVDVFDLGAFATHYGPSFSQDFAMSILTATASDGGWRLHKHGRAA